MTGTFGQLDSFNYSGILLGGDSFGGCDTVSNHNSFFLGDTVELNDSLAYAGTLAIDGSFTS